MLRKLAVYYFLLVIQGLLFQKITSRYYDCYFYKSPSRRSTFNHLNAWALSFIFLPAFKNVPKNVALFSAVFDLQSAFHSTFRGLPLRNGKSSAQNMYFSPCPWAWISILKKILKLHISFHISQEYSKKIIYRLTNNLDSELILQVKGFKGWEE